MKATNMRCVGQRNQVINGKSGFFSCRRKAKYIVNYMSFGKIEATYCCNDDECIKSVKNDLRDCPADFVKIKQK